MKTKFLAGLFIAVAATLSQGWAQESLKKDDRIVFLGDSITAAGARPNGYITLVSNQIAQLYPELNVKLIGAGMGGHKVPDCQKRLQSDVLDHKPTIVFIYIGINDVWHWTHPKAIARGKKGTTPEDFDSGLRDMIGKIKDAGARVILCSPTVIGEKHDGSNPDDAKLDEYANISRKVAKETGSQLLDLRTAFITHLKQHNTENLEQGILTSDRVHLNETGNRLIADLVLEALKVTVDTNSIERGRTVYSQLCFNCHGPKLDGGQGPSLVDEYWQHGSSPEAILQVIDKGVPGSPMIGYENVFPEADRRALRDFIISEQEGLREVVRSVYPDEYFKGKRLTPELFDSVESLSQTPLPENLYHFERHTRGLMRGISKLYIKETGNYHFGIRVIGRTSIYLNGEEVHYSDEKVDAKQHINKTFELEAGVHHLEILHEEKPSHSYRFYGVLQKVGGHRMPLAGRSLQGNIPKVIKAGPTAMVVRKWIKDLPPRALMCLLPNQVIVAFDADNGQIIKAWHSAEVNQTPSLPDRSARPSEINGEVIADPVPSGIGAKQFQFRYYETDGEAALITAMIDGDLKTVKITPADNQSYQVNVQ